MGRLRALGVGFCFVVLASSVSACGGSDSGAGPAGGSGGTGAGGSGGTGAGGSGGTGAGATGGGGTGATGGSPGLFDCSAPSGTLNLTLTSVGDGLSRPVYITSPPGDTARLFVLEQPGRIQILSGGQQTLFLDITDKVNDGGNEQGLLGLAFPADYSTTGKFYVHYTGPSGEATISEFSVSSDPDSADPTSEKVILTVDEPQDNHNGGAINFGPDGMLYIGLGDGGGAGDAHGPTGNGQSTNVLLGKILRIDVNNPGGGKEYGIPAGNMSGANTAPELWSYGLRNPWRWSFDACTGDMYIGDVGQGTIEEIDVEPAGKGSGTNYGWRVMEGSSCYNAGTCDKTGKQLPVTEYTHSAGGCSVTGGYVYRGSKVPALRGTYIYGDYCSKKMWSFQYDGSGAASEQEITGDIGSASIGEISSFGQDATGELYVASFDGNVYRIDAE